MNKAVDFAIKDALAIAGRDAVAHFKKSFDEEGFTDSTLQKWERRKGQIRGGGIVRLKKKGINTKKTLTKTGALKRSIRITSFSAKKTEITSDLPYSGIHNAGLRGRVWGKHSFQMPKRQYMGNSRKLERYTYAKFIAKVNTAIRNL